MSDSTTSALPLPTGLEKSNENIEVKLTLAEIDATNRVPALFFLSASLLWLLFGSLLGFIASYKLHNPEFLAAWDWLTFGRVRSAHLNAMAYGWSNNAAFALSLWMMSRLCRVPLKHYGFLYLGGGLWNLAVIIGIGGILFGQMTSVEWLEMPISVTPLVALGAVSICFWGILTFRRRQPGHVYVSQWYILAALFWFPWLYTIAQIMLFWAPARGTVQSLVNWWFAHNVLGLWLTPMGLATVYYILPKILGKPIHSYYLSLLGFWSLALFYNWAGVHHLIGGPVPAWVISAGTVGSVMMVIPVVVTAINHHFTMFGSFGALKRSPSLRFIVFGAMNYTLTSFAGSAMAVRSINEVTHFTHFTVAHAHHGVYAFFAMVMFGGIYYMLPRLLQREWPSAVLISIHFWACALGILLYVIGLSIGGLIQGLQMNDAENYPIFLDIVKNTVPYLKSRTLAAILLSIGHVAFFINFVWMVVSKRSADREGPTLLGSAN